MKICLPMVAPIFYGIFLVDFEGKIRKQMTLANKSEEIYIFSNPYSVVTVYFDQKSPVFFCKKKKIEKK